MPTLTNPRKKIIIQLLGYRLRDGPKDNDMSEILLDGTQIQHRFIEELERGLEYEFRIAGRNKIGYGQEAVRFLPTPEGAPSGNILQLENYYFFFYLLIYSFIYSFGY